MRGSQFKPAPEFVPDDWESRIVPAQTMDDVCDYIPLIPEVLAFGGPLKKKVAEALVKANVSCIVDLTDSTAETPWYAEIFPPGSVEICRKFKLEGSRMEDDELSKCFVKTHKHANASCAR